MKLSSELEQKVEGEFPNKILDVTVLFQSRLPAGFRPDKTIQVDWA